MGRVEINIPNRIRNKIALKGVLIVLLIILVSSSTIIIPFYYVSEKHLDNSTHNINDLRGVSGLTISDLQMETNGERLIIKAGYDISILDAELNYQYTLKYTHGGSRSDYSFELLGIFDNQLFVIFRYYSWDTWGHSGIISWDLNTQEIVTNKELYYVYRHSLSLDCSRLAISSNNSMYLIELSNPDLITEIKVPNDYLTYSWINNHEMAFFYSDSIIKYDTDNHSTITSDIIPLNYYPKPLVISGTKFLFSNQTSFIIYDQSKNNITEVLLEPRYYFRSIAINYGSEYIVGSVYKSDPASINSLIFWDTEGNLVDKFSVSFEYHTLDWNNKNQKLVGAAENGNFTIFTLSSVVLDTIKNKNYLIPLYVLILIVLIVYVIKKFVIRKNIKEEKGLYPLTGKN